MNVLENFTADILLEDLKETGVQGMLKAYQSQIIPSKSLFDFFGEFGEESLVQLFLASYSNTPSKLLINIYNSHPDIEVLCALARHPRTSHDIMQELSAHESSLVRRTVAANRHITPQTANIIAHDEEAYIRCLLAENPDLYQRLQLELADDSSSMVKVALAQNRKPYNLLIDKLLLADDPFVKTALAIHQQLPNRSLLAIADSENKLAQMCLYQRDELPLDVLESLSFSEHPEVSLQALKRKELSPDEMLGWAECEDSGKRKLIAGQEILPNEIQEIIAGFDDIEVLKTLAANAGLCDKAALRLLKQDILDVTMALTANPALGEAVIKELCELQDTDIHKALALRDDLNEQHLDILINRHQNLDVIYHLCINGKKFTKLNRDLTRSLIKSPLPTLRAFGACSETLDHSDLPRLSYDVSCQVKLCLVSNPAVTETILNFLCSDQNDEVVKAATVRLEALRAKAAAEAAEAAVKEEEENRIKGPKIISKLFGKLTGS